MLSLLPLHRLASRSSFKLVRRTLPSITLANPTYQSCQTQTKQLSTTSASSTHSPLSESMLQTLEQIENQQKLIIAKWGFVQKEITLKSGEVVGFLEKAGLNSSSSSSSPTLLMLHGMTQDSLTFSPFASSLKVPPHVRILIPDLAGHGSRIPYTVGLGEEYMGWSSDERKDDVLEFLNAIDVSEPVDVFGYSMGGGAALSLAAYHPEKVNKVALISPACGATKEAINEMKSGVIRYNYSTLEEAEEMMSFVGFHPNVMKARAPVLLGSRIKTGVDREYWAKAWSGLVNGDVIKGLGLTISDAMLDYTRERAILVYNAGKDVLVVQGGADRIIHGDVPSTIEKAFAEGGEGKGKCVTHICEGIGHSGAPNDEKGLIARPAGEIGRAFLYGN